MVKTIGSFKPIQEADPLISERHYVNVHSRYVRELFRHQAPGVVRYLPHKVLGQYDINGRFGQAPDAWRFVISELSDGTPPYRQWPTETADVIWNDHLNCIQDMRGFVVEESVVLDRRSGQTSLAKYLFLYDQPAEVAGNELGAYLADKHFRPLMQVLETAFGFRLYIANRVLMEAETADLDRPAQIYTGHFLGTTERCLIEEFWFDNEDWAEEFFASRAARALLRDGYFAKTAGYAVEEQTGIDRR